MKIKSKKRFFVIIIALLTNVFSSFSLVCFAEQSNTEYQFENSVAGFSNASVIEDTTGTDYGFTERSGNHILEPTVGKTCTLKLNQAVNGVLVYQFDMFNDYYYGESDEEFINNNDPRKDNKYASFWTYLGNSSAKVRLFNISKSGNYASAHTGWSTNKAVKHKWYTYKITVNTTTGKMSATYKSVGASDSEYQQINFQSAANGVNGHSEIYTFNGESVGTNNNGVLVDNIDRIIIANQSEFIDNWIDNVYVSVCDSLSDAVNNCSTTDDVKTCLNNYTNLGISVFSFGSNFQKIQSSEEKESVYDQLLKNVPYDSDLAVQDTFNNIVDSILSVSDGATYFLNNDFETTENNSFLGGLVKTSPTVSWNNSLYVNANSSASASFSGKDIKKYLNMKLRVYAEEGANVKIGLNSQDSTLFSVLNNCIVTNADKSLAENVSNRWIDLICSLDTDTNYMNVYVKDNNKNFLINTITASNFDKSPNQSINISTAGSNAWIDDVVVSTTDALEQSLAKCKNSACYTKVINYAVEYGNFLLPSLSNMVLENEMSNIYKKCYLENISNSDEIYNLINDKVIEKLKKNSSNNMILYDYHKDNANNIVTGYDFCINDDIEYTDSVVTVFAAYSDTTLKDVNMLLCDTGIKTGDKIKLTIPTIDNAVQYKVLVLDKNTLKPVLSPYKLDFGANSIDSQLYPGWVRKSITFTYDDANIGTDMKALGYINNVGMKATFNFVSDTMRSYINTYNTEDEYREIYGSHEISSHSKYHSKLVPDGVDPDTDLEYTVATDSRFENMTGLYWNSSNGNKRLFATESTYQYSVDKAIEEIEQIFGEGTVRGYAWPFGINSISGNKTIENYVKSKHDYVRNASFTLGKDGFNVPADWSEWNATASYYNLLSLAEEYRVLPDDGKLKFFCAGIHTSDYDTENTDGTHSDYWYQLEEFCNTISKEQEKYWYATNIEILDYLNCINKLEISSSGIYNPTSNDIYVSINNNNIVIPAHSSFGA